MRTTIDLIHELEAEAQRFTGVALAGFDKTTTFIFADDPKRLGKLNEAVEAGGQPVGMLAFNLEDGGHRLQLFSRPIAECTEMPMVQNYLNSLTQTLREIIKHKYPGVDGYQVMGEWLN
jgi:hypothetical protein